MRGVRGGRKAACCAPRFFREGHYTQYIIAFAYIYIYIYIFLALYIYIYMFKRSWKYIIIFGSLVHNYYLRTSTTSYKL